MDKEKETRKDDNIVYIGEKPVMNYVTAVNMQLSRSKEVTIVSRGKFISRAVDVAEVSKRFNEGVEITKIDTGSEPYKNKEGKEINVSTIAIVVTKK